jgi:hypothetical protein
VLLDNIIKYDKAPNFYPASFLNDRAVRPPEALLVVSVRGHIGVVDTLLSVRGHRG